MLYGGADSYSLLLLVLRSCSLETLWPCVRADLLTLSALTARPSTSSGMLCRDLGRVSGPPVDVFAAPVLSEVGSCKGGHRKE